MLCNIKVRIILLTRLHAFLPLAYIFKDIAKWQFFRSNGARKIHSFAPLQHFRGYMIFLLLPENLFLAHESFLECFSDIVSNTCETGKMLRAPKARVEIFLPHLLDCGYAPDFENSSKVTQQNKQRRSVSQNIHRLTIEMYIRRILKAKFQA